jgi:hypothetical protein
MLRQRGYTERLADSPLGFSRCPRFHSNIIWPWGLWSLQMPNPKMMGHRSIKCPEWTHPNGHVMSGIVEMLPDM